MAAIRTNQQAPQRTDGEPAPANPLDAAYRWLSGVEELCQKAFVPDEVIANRSRAKIASRTRTLKTVKIGVPAKAKGELHVIPAANVLDSWLRRLDAPMPEADERKAGEMASRGMANRDLLAHRLGRPIPTIRWKGCQTDQYGHGGKAYRRRLAAVGRIISDLGWLDEPPTHPWRQNRPQAVPDMADREAQADRIAAEMFP